MFYADNKYNIRQRAKSKKTFEVILTLILIENAGFSPAFIHSKTNLAYPRSCGSFNDAPTDFGFRQETD
jgi:hypothetical protein